MLSRIAESLFWIGRYLERADDTARLLDVQIHQRLEDNSAPRFDSTSAILSVMGMTNVSVESGDFGALTELLAFDSSQPNSVVSCLRSARENARGIRESISSEFWECLNSTVITMSARSSRSAEPHSYFSFSHFVRERAAIAGGIVDASTTRDDGWRFFVIGRSIERVDMTARLLALQLNKSLSEVDWPATLRACSAYEAYLRRYRGTLSAVRVLEFLMLDHNFPRSICFSLGTAEGCLSALEPMPGRASETGEAHRIIGRTLALLRYRTIGEIVQNVSQQLSSLQAACSLATSSIASEYFQHDAVLAWRTDGSSIASPGVA